MRVKICSITLVPRTLLEIHAVGQNLLPDLGHQNILAEFSPIGGSFKERQLCTYVIKSEALAREVRVRAVVFRQIQLNMAGVMIKKLQCIAK